MAQPQGEEFTSAVQKTGRRDVEIPGHRDIKTLQKFGSIHASIHNHFNLERHLNRRETFKENRAAALAEWRQLAA